MWMAALLLLACWLGVTVWGFAVRGKDRRFGIARRMLAGRPTVWREHLLIMPYLPLVDRLSHYGYTHAFIAGIHYKLTLLERDSAPPDIGRHWLAECAGMGFSSGCALALLAAAADETAILVIAVALIPLIPALRIRRLHRHAEERRREIIVELPGLLGKLMLLVGAGETVQAALIRCAGADQTPNKVLFTELGRAVHAMRNGDSFQLAMENFGRRCGVQEVSVFVAVLLLNYRKGGDRFALSLRELSYGLWEKRKAIARTQAEEAASKLSLPLVFVFLILMILVGAPAIMSI